MEKSIISGREHASSPHKDGWASWQTAVERGDLPTCRRLATQRDDVTVVDQGSGRTLLHLAAGRGHMDVCKLLVANGLSVNDLDDGQNTPLFYAARNGNVALCQWMVDAGASTIAKNKGGNTLLHWAAQAKESGAIEFFLRPHFHRSIPDLLLPSIELDATNDGGYTALSEAAEVNCEASCRALLAAGANPDHRPVNADGLTPDYLTPFERAVEDGRLNLASLFAKHRDIDPFIQTAAGDSLLDLAAFDAKMVEFVHSMMTDWSVRHAFPSDEVTVPLRRASPGPL